MDSDSVVYPDPYNFLNPDSYQKLGGIRIRIKNQNDRYGFATLDSYPDQRKNTDSSGSETSDYSVILCR